MLFSLLAEATTETSGFGGRGLITILMMVIMVVVMYFLMIRPQKKQQKEQEEMMSALKPGDSIMTTSGFYGIVLDIVEDTVIVEFGNNKNCRIPMNKAAIATVEKPENAVEEEPETEDEQPEEKGKKKKSMGKAK